jgi:PEP-CTERM motif
MIKEFSLLAVTVALASISSASTFSTSATSTIGSANCSQTGTSAASCSQTVGFDSVGSSGASNFSSITSGLLDVVVNATHMAGGFNASPSGTASASFSVPLEVTGGNGTGLLMVTFNGFDMATTSNGPATNPVLSIMFGTLNTTFTPPGAPGAFSFQTPFTYDTPFTLSASISASGTAPFLMMNAASSANIEGRVSLTGFTVLTSQGDPASGTVNIVPEPAAMSLAGLGIATVLLLSARRRQC